MEEGNKRREKGRVKKGRVEKGTGRRRDRVKGRDRGGKQEREGRERLFRRG